MSWYAVFAILVRGLTNMHIKLRGQRGVSFGVLQFSVFLGLVLSLFNDIHGSPRVN
jgi:hypothetical protein